MAGYWVITLVGRGDPSTAIVHDPHYAVVTHFVRHDGSGRGEPPLLQVAPGTWPGIIAELGDLQVTGLTKLDSKPVVEVWHRVHRMRGLFPALCDAMFMARLQFGDCTLSQLQLRSPEQWEQLGLERKHAETLIENSIIGVELFLRLNGPTLLSLPGITNDNIRDYQAYQRRLR
jgi:hypothetical protein